MNIIISKTTDYQEILAFGNRIFNTTFETLLPKLYNEAALVADNHYLIKQEAAIKAMVGSFPNELSVLDETLTFHGIGTVSVDPTTRGSGFMKQLMNHAVEEGKLNGVDFMILGGQRQRYEYYGFTPCSTELEFTAGESAFRHSQRFLKMGFSFAPLGDNLDHISECTALYNAQPVHSKRSEQDFILVCNSWHGLPYAIIYDDMVCGYLVADKDFNIKEIVLGDYKNTLPVVLAWVAAFEVKRLSVTTLFFQRELAGQLDQIMEEMKITRGSCINVLNYKNVIRAALKFKGMHTPLMHGKLVIDVLDVGRYSIVVDAAGVLVEDSTEVADVSLPHISMMQFLFSPVNFIGHTGVSPKIVSRWFPLQIGISSLDNS